jgi:hypothetical protein
MLFAAISEKVEIFQLFRQPAPAKENNFGQLQGSYSQEKSG